MSSQTGCSRSLTICKAHIAAPLPIVVTRRLGAFVSNSLFIKAFAVMAECDSSAGVRYPVVGGPLIVETNSAELI